MSSLNLPLSKQENIKGKRSTTENMPGAINRKCKFVKSCEIKSKPQSFQLPVF